jgi:hypothetical protein
MDSIGVLMGSDGISIGLIGILMGSAGITTCPILVETFNVVALTWVVRFVVKF